MGKATSARLARTDRNGEPCTGRNAVVERIMMTRHKRNEALAAMKERIHRQRWRDSFWIDRPETDEPCAVGGNTTLEHFLLALEGYAFALEWDRRETEAQRMLQRWG